MHAMRLLMPPAWHGVDSIDPDLRAFYEYYAHAHGAVGRPGRHRADRRPLRRAARWTATACVRRASSSRRIAHLTIASEIGVWDYKPEDVVRKGKLGPGEMIALDLQTGTLLEQRDIDNLLKSRHPYKTWLQEGRALSRVGPRSTRALAAEPMDRETLTLYQKMFNITAEERDEIIRVLARGRERGGRLDGRRHADAGAVAQGAPALRLLPPAVRAGDQPADRSAARVAS